eukprot:m51a1_g9723 hypothetical protein (643) ;mRNA; f:1479227-1481523
MGLHSNSLHAATQFSVSQVRKDAPDVGDTRPSAFGGYRDALASSEAFVDALLRPFLFEAVGACNPGGLLVTGTKGVGKTSFATQLAERFARAPLFCHSSALSCSRISGHKPDAIREDIRAVLWEAARNAPAVVLLDDLDAVAPAPSGSPEEEASAVDAQAAVAVREMLWSLRSVHGGRGVAVVATAASATAVHPVLQACNVFGRTVELLPPNKRDRQSIIGCLAASRGLALSEESASRAASECDGYVAVDLAQIVDKAANRLGTGARRELSAEDLAAAMADFTPMSLMGVKSVSSEVSWDDVGGLQDVKAALKETLEWPSKFPHLYESCPIRMRSGVLLYGPPGCGKTMLAQAVARECSLNFISVKGPELLSKYIGQSELAVRDLFRRAAAARPAILFFDEFDALAPRRGHDTTGVTDRVVNQLLTQLDGVEALTGVYVLAASSRPDLIDPALLRPGRIDLCLHCRFPRQEDMADVLRAVSRKFTVDDSLDIAELATRFGGDAFTPADLRAIFYTAQLQSVKDTIAQLPLGGGSAPASSSGSGLVFLGGDGTDGGEEARAEAMRVLEERADWTGEERQERQSQCPVITLGHLEQSIAKTRPAISPIERKRYDRLYADFVRSRTAGPSATPALSPSQPRQTLA